jgi:hypothetical protein
MQAGSSLASSPLASSPSLAMREDRFELARGRSSTSLEADPAHHRKESADAQSPSAALADPRAQRSHTAGPASHAHLPCQTLPDEEEEEEEEEVEEEEDAALSPEDEKDERFAVPPGALRVGPCAQRVLRRPSVSHRRLGCRSRFVSV